MRKLKLKSACLSKASQKYRMRKNLEVSQSKPTVSCSVFIGPFTK